MTSYYGTLSLYSSNGHRCRSYAATRVHQFFEYDNEQHDENLYEKQTAHPRLCGYELNPYEVQPGAPSLGPFKDSGDILTEEEFQRKRNFAVEFATQEELFYSD